MESGKRKFFVVFDINNADSQSQKRVSPDPAFIQYMFDSSKNFSSVFLVGNAYLGPPEKIGVCKDLLMAHSESFRLMLGESALAETGIIEVKDIQPETFRNLLRFVYGYNNLSMLNMEEAVDLMYVAEKYLVEELKFSLSNHICSILTCDNVFIPIQRPECLLQNSLKHAIEKILRRDINIVLRSKDFVTLNKLGVITILQQELLDVDEIELWKAVLNWAYHNNNAGPNKVYATNLREVLKEFLEYIRFCTFTLQDFCKHVFLTKILTYEESLLIIESICNKIVNEDLTTVCNTLENRRNINCRYFWPITYNGPTSPSFGPLLPSYTSTSLLNTPTSP